MIRGIFDEPVIVEEKIDGSQISFGLVNGELVIRSRNQRVDPENPGMFAKAVEEIQLRAPMLTPGVVYRGEYLMSPKHNTLAYDRVPKGHIVLFDIMVAPEDYLGNFMGEKRNRALTLDFEPVPVLFHGVVSGPDELRGYLDLTSVLGGAKIEGVVVKNINRFSADGKPMFGKFVSDRFKEIHGGEWRKNNPAPSDITDRIIAKYRTPARWQKAIQHLQEAGNLDGSPKDIGPLMKEIGQDVLSECGEDIMRELMKYYWPRIQRGITRGMPEWYKDQLLESAFEGDDELSD